MFRIAEVKRLLKDHGEPVTISTPSAGVYNAATGKYTAGTATSQTVTGYFYDIKRENDYDTLAQLGDRKLLIAGDITNSPKVGDTVSGHRETGVITRVSEIMSGTKVVAYLLRFKH